MWQSTEDGAIVKANFVVSADQLEKLHWSSVLDLRTIDFIVFG
jgi:hypothetical protein